MSKEKKQPKTLLQKIWYFIWDDDSIWSWIVNVVIAFLLIKFVVYPGLGLGLGTTHPVVAVVSGSMEHRLSGGQICGINPEVYTSTLDGFWSICGDFYRNYDINEVMFSKFPFKNGFSTGDIIVLLGKKPADINVGDVIVFKADKPDPIIHRVIKKWVDNDQYYFTTKGDHNPSSLYFETSISQDRLIGKAVFKIPWLGYIKIWFVDLLRLTGLSNTLGRLF
jgi:signal peptidase I